MAGGTRDRTGPLHRGEGAYRPQPSWHFVLIPDPSGGTWRRACSRSGACAEGRRAGTARCGCTRPEQSRGPQIRYPARRRVAHARTVGAYLWRARPLARVDGEACRRAGARVATVASASRRWPMLVQQVRGSLGTLAAPSAPPQQARRSVQTASTTPCCLQLYCPNPNDPPHRVCFACLEPLFSNGIILTSGAATAECAQGHPARWSDLAANLCDHRSARLPCLQAWRGATRL